MQPEVVPLPRAQVRAAAAVVAQAFQDDPLIVWVAPDEQTRHRVTASMFVRQLDYAWRYGRVDTTPQVAGVAVWLTPGRTRMRTWGMIRAGLWTTPLHLGWRGLRRIRTFDAHKTRLHRQAVPAPHWYLLVLAVSPAAQGQGLGKALVQPVLHQADRDRLPCYLETSNTRNVSLFERLGFAVVGEDQVPGGGPYLWAMLRQPRRISPAALGQGVG